MGLGFDVFTPGPLLSDAPTNMASMIKSHVMRNGRTSKSNARAQ
nr:MAG TPA: hypothetical protein [Caudoviricetes sp.]